MSSNEDFLTESYNEVLNEGLWDRTKASASGIGQSIKNFGQGAKHAGTFAKQSLIGGAKGATGDADAVAKTKDVKQASKQQFDNRTTGKQAKAASLKNIHIKKLAEALKGFEKEFTVLTNDFVSDMAKSGVFQQNEIEQTKADYIKSFKDNLTNAFLKAPEAKEQAVETPSTEGSTEQYNAQ